MNENDGRRTTERADVHILAEMRQHSLSYFRVRLDDLSTTGFRMHYSGRLDPAAELTLRMPGLAPIKARIRWTRDYEHGCQFLTPLYPAVFDHIVRQAKAA